MDGGEFYMSWKVLDDPLGEDGGIIPGTALQKMEVIYTLILGNFTDGTTLEGEGQRYTVTTMPNERGQFLIDEQENVYHFTSGYGSMILYKKGNEPEAQ